MGERLAGGNVALALLGNTLPTGAILVVLILALGPISGAHFNPAVSLVMSLRKNHPWREFFPTRPHKLSVAASGLLLRTGCSSCRCSSLRSTRAPALRDNKHRRLGALAGLGVMSWFFTPEPLAEWD
jgi:glycerol uptake facilitator-like aquaporin